MREDDDDVLRDDYDDDVVSPNHVALSTNYSGYRPQAPRLRPHFEVLPWQKVPSEG